jgi:hypothetical protein
MLRQTWIADLMFAPRCLRRDRERAKGTNNCWSLDPKVAELQSTERAGGDDVRWPTSCCDRAATGLRQLCASISVINHVTAQTLKQTSLKAMRIACSQPCLPEKPRS